MSEPTSISASLTQADLDAARTANRAILQERFPTYDLSVGGSVDGLLVDGLSTITARNDKDVDTAYLYQQLKAISDGTVTVDDEDVDRLMANYFITRRAATFASGSVVFVVRDNVPYSFQSGYRLRSEAYTYQLLSTYSVYPAATAGVDFTVSTNVAIQQIYDAETGYSYQFTLPITSLEAVPGAVLVAGDRLTVDQLFDGLGYVQAVTNFSGGFPAETNQAFVQRGLSGLLARTVGGQDHIRALVQDVIPLADVSVVGVSDSLMSRDRDNVFNISTGGKADVYVKAGAVSQAGYANVVGVVQDVGTRTIRITLTREQSAGVYRQSLYPLYTSTPPVIVAGGLTVSSVSNLPWVAAGSFNPAMPAQYDRAFSARQQIQIDFVDDREDSVGYVVALTAPGQELENTYQVAVEYQPGILDADAALTSTEVRPAGTDVLVKAAVPCITTVSVTATRPVDYNGPLAAVLAAELASSINQLPITTTFLDALTIAALLRNIEPSLIVQGVTLSGSIYGQDGTTLSVVMSAGKLTLPLNTAAKVGPHNTYFTTTSGLTTVTLV